MSTYKLTFFGGRGRAEVIRLCFAHADVPFEDIRVEHADFRKNIGDSPFYELPVLEVDGVKLLQSNAIAHFVAKRCNLAGKCDVEEAQCIMIVNCLDEIVSALIDCYHHMRTDLFDFDVNKVPEMKRQLETEFVPPKMARLEKLLALNKNGDYFVGDGLTYADISMMHHMQWFDIVGVNPHMDKYPKVKALIARVASFPRIAEWREKHKHHPY